MSVMPIEKYQAYCPIDFPQRQWPSRSIDKSPVWCSVDLRDGNQSLRIPMNLDEKLLFFQLLVDIGFKEIEVGFPAASQIEYEFVRALIEQELIPDDVTIQVLSQSRKSLIEKTFDSVKGAKNVIFHLYNSTSTLQRDVVFKMDKPEIIDIALQGTRLVKKGVAEFGKETSFVFQYSPESFTGTEPEFALEICQRVAEEWSPAPSNKMILNLPATVEMFTPNLYADMIEWFCCQFPQRDSVIISLHTHNDRGTGVAATELGLMAGAERVEGTIFGCGERTGNVDIVNLALNLFSQGVDPKLDFSNINHIAGIYEKCTGMPIHPRHPYVGELVYTAFSGSHQDAINKGMEVYDRRLNKTWAVPYLPIDPRDVGRTYEKIIQINSQSGKGGVAYVMEQQFGYKLPKSMHPEFGLVVQKESEKTGEDVHPEKIFELFNEAYLSQNAPFEFKGCEIQTKNDETRVIANFEYSGELVSLSGSGNGPLDALGNGIKREGYAQFLLTSYSEHALTVTTSSQAAAYIQLEFEGVRIFGVGVDANISIASIKALFSALNRAHINGLSLRPEKALKN